MSQDVLFTTPPPLDLMPLLGYGDMTDFESLEWAGQAGLAGLTQQQGQQQDQLQPVWTNPSADTPPRPDYYLYTGGHQANKYQEIFNTLELNWAIVWVAGPTTQPWCYVDHSALVAAWRQILSKSSISDSTIRRYYKNATGANLVTVGNSALPGL